MKSLYNLFCNSFRKRTAEACCRASSREGASQNSVHHGFVWAIFVGQDLSWRKLVSIAVPGQVLAYSLSPITRANRERASRI